MEKKCSYLIIILWFNRFTVLRVFFIVQKERIALLTRKRNCLTLQTKLSLIWSQVVKRKNVRQYKSCIADFRFAQITVTVIERTHVFSFSLHSYFLTL